MSSFHDTIPVKINSRHLAGASTLPAADSTCELLHFNVQDYRGTKITARVSILRVVSTEFEDRGGRCTHHHEIAIYVPALIRALNAMPSGDSEYSMSDEEQLSQLTAFLELCKDLQSVVYL